MMYEIFGFFRSYFESLEKYAYYDEYFKIFIVIAITAFTIIGLKKVIAKIVFFAKKYIEKLGEFSTKITEKFLKKFIKDRA